MLTEQRTALMTQELEPHQLHSSLSTGLQHPDRFLRCQPSEQFPGELGCHHPHWVGTGTTLSDRGLGIKSSVFASQDLVGKATNCPGNPASDSGLGFGGSQNPRTLLGAGEVVT